MSPLGHGKAKRELVWNPEPVNESIRAGAGPGESKDPSRKWIRTILGAISEYDREMIADRLEAARKAKAAAGGYAHGALPYGRRSEGGKLIPHDAERVTLRRMRELRDAGKSTRDITAALTAEVHPTKRGGEWSSPTVSGILSRDAEG